MELIIYLEPSKEVKQSVELFLTEMEQKYGSTTANKYSCHTSMTGFFRIEEDQVNEIIEFLNKDTIHFRSRKDATPQINFNSIIAYDKSTNTPKHLLLPIKAPQIYHDMMDKLSKVVPFIRVKRIDHISLAYWDEPQATTDQREDWEERNKSQIFDNMKRDADIYFKDTKNPLQWDIVLYERVYKGVLIGQHHEFKELGRWPSSSSTTVI